ncbi:KICSTOR subunit 2-like [Anthonomus grandis grandis]|uniref:KICSTOR subunit 2-like n=1 Tax=Anthonomus grandis grandis TaxID=2921223 RepID=UPI0021661C92|nr:KICSTOR subunit 2-like [Anthonomus grandis grandis]
MEKEDEFLFNYFTLIAQLCFEKAKDNVEKDKPPKSPATPWTTFLNVLQQLATAEKNYMDMGFLQNRQKSFLRKDNSLRAVYEYMKNDLRKIEDSCKNSNPRLQNYCQNIMQLLNARVSLMDLYEKIYNVTMTNKLMNYMDMLNIIENIIQTHYLGFTDITLTPMKAVFSLECEVLQQMFKAMFELQNLQFLPSLASIHGAHARLNAWESKMQREIWRLGIFKNSPLPALFQWLQKLKGGILSKFSLYFHDVLANQTPSHDMKHICSKLQCDFYQKMVNFQKKYEAACIVLLSDGRLSCEAANYENFPVIVSYPLKNPPQVDMMLKLISETSEFSSLKPVTKFRFEDHCTYCLTLVEPNIYFVVLFQSKKTEKDTWIGTFVNDFCTSLRFTKIFVSLKNHVK